ncbi:hypothetical protein LNP04_05565 [Chryseobacterium sp. C-71]|uniref:hypothetical protein n=1 Tax=Chryseobacterium sp. C-71 TaxID=2893882 RepID=UPI001E2DD852|nr:hypothetical protein [Chryseobacterium sp. C-71]UFH33184.1 hypothetical protein LNP04_05565 [Chryseobacterium sp. C-71]
MMKLYFLFLILFPFHLFSLRDYSLGEINVYKNLKIVSEVSSMIENKKDFKSVFSSKIYSDAFISNFLFEYDLELRHSKLNEHNNEDFKTSTKLKTEVGDNDKRNFVLAKYYQKSLEYLINKKIEKGRSKDSILLCLNKSSEALHKIKDNSKTVTPDLKYDAIIRNNILFGIFYLEHKNLTENLGVAEKYLMYALRICETKKYKFSSSNYVVLLNQLGRLYLEKKEFKKSIVFVKRAIALEKQYYDPYHRVESLKLLTNNYLQIGDKERSK